MVTKPSNKTLVRWVITLVTLSYIPLLFFNSGFIISEQYAYIQGWYSNYYQVRITLSLLLAVIILLTHRGNWRYLLLVAPLWVVHFLILPDPLLLIRIWKAVVFTIKLFAFAVSLRIWLRVLPIKWEQFKAVSLSTVLIFEALLMMLQTLFQKSVFPTFLSMLGQPSIPSPGGAQEVIVNRYLPETGQFYLPYGTLPHPNIAAGLAALGFILLFSIPISGKVKLIKYTGLASCIVIIGLSFSFTVWLLGIFIGLSIALHRLFGRRFSRWSTLITTVIGLLIVAGIYLASQYFFISSLSVRNQLNLAALSEAAKSLWGIGWYQFIPYIMQQPVFPGLLSQYWQPVHNIWLLVLAELGIPLGITFFVVWGWVITKLVQIRDSQTILRILLLLWLVVVGSLDHYIITYIL